jgi:hypothetical protein
MQVRFKDWTVNRLLHTGDGCHKNVYEYPVNSEMAPVNGDVAPSCRGRSDKLVRVACMVKEPEQPIPWNDQ